MLRTMKKILLLFLGTGVAAAAQTPFADCFSTKRCASDYYHAGDSRSEEYFFDALKEEPYWAGSKVSLVDTTGYGNQFSHRGPGVGPGDLFPRLLHAFNEWQSTPEADSVRRSYPGIGGVPPIPNVRAGSRFSPATAKGVSRSVSARISTPIPILSSGSRPAARRSEVMYSGHLGSVWTSSLLPRGLHGAGERAKFRVGLPHVAADEFFSYSL